MSLKFTIEKYATQIKAMLPSSAIHYELKNDPIIFKNEDNIKLSFACIADTHFSNKEYLAHNLNNCFLDLKNCNKGFDALLVAGDITEFSTRGEFKRFFSVTDKYFNDLKILLTLGNHDARLFYNNSKKSIMKKVEEYLKINTDKKAYYSYDINGYTFIVLCTEKRVLEKAYISKEQIEFLDKELKRASESNKPIFVMCHQAFQFTHGLPEVWKTGDMGEQSDEVRVVLEKYKNVFFINGHLHGGVFEKTFEVLNEENGVYSLSIPAYRKENNFGMRDLGVGYFAEVYDDEVIFTARNFVEGKIVDCEYSKFNIQLKK